MDGPGGRNGIYFEAPAPELPGPRSEFKEGPLSRPVAVSLLILG